MTKVLEYAEAGDTVIVWHIDRLGRSLIDVLNAVELLRGRGIHVRSLSAGIGPETSTGRLMLHMFATLAEYERELIVERVNAGIAAARDAGTRFRRPRVNPNMIAEKLEIVATVRPWKPLHSSAGARQRFADTRATSPARPQYCDISNSLSVLLMRIS